MTQDPWHIQPSDHTRPPGCRCERPIANEDTCLLCGHLLTPAVHNPLEDLKAA